MAKGVELRPFYLYSKKQTVDLTWGKSLELVDYRKEGRSVASYQLCR
jgi:hypothetical protein